MALDSNEALVVVAVLALLAFAVVCVFVGMLLHRQSLLDSRLRNRYQLEDERHLGLQELAPMLRTIQGVMVGHHSGGMGEGVLEELFHKLPADLIRRNLRVNGKVVEFGLQVPNGKVVPIDSKFTALDSEDRQVLDGAVAGRVREVAQYIDPAVTTPWAIAAVPDAAYEACRTAFAEAQRCHVVVVGYSMVLPYVLLVQHMHLQYARGVDLQNLQANVMDMERQLDILDRALENQVERPATTLHNAYRLGRQVTSRLRAVLQSIQIVGMPQGETRNPLPGLDATGNQQELGDRTIQSEGMPGEEARNQVPGVYAAQGQQELVLGITQGEGAPEEEARNQMPGVDATREQKEPAAPSRRTRDGVVARPRRRVTDPQELQRRRDALAKARAALAAKRQARSTLSGDSELP